LHNFWGLLVSFWDLTACDLFPLGCRDHSTPKKGQISFYDESQFDSLLLQLVSA
jgi:hypothetical protein